MLGSMLCCDLLKLLTLFIKGTLHFHLHGPAHLLTGPGGRCRQEIERGGLGRVSALLVCAFCAP